MLRTLSAFFVGVLLSAAVAQSVDSPPPAGTEGILCAYNLVVPTPTTGKLYYVQCDGSGNIKTAGTVTTTAAPVTATARGGAITLGGTSQTLMAANASRVAFTIQNPCSATEQGIATAEDLFINITSAATVSTNANLAVLPPCSSFSWGLNGGTISQAAITVNAASTSHIWYAKEF